MVKAREPVHWTPVCHVRGEAVFAEVLWCESLSSIHGDDQEPSVSRYDVHKFSFDCHRGSAFCSGQSGGRSGGDKEWSEAVRQWGHGIMWTVNRVNSMKRRETNKKGIEEKGRIKKKWERRCERGTSQELNFISTGGGWSLHNNGEEVLPIQHCQKQVYNKSQKFWIL